MSLHSSIVCTGVRNACSLPISARYGDAYRHGRFPEGWAPGEHYPEKWARRFAVISLVVI